jgi:hypothetical protein
MALRFKVREMALIAEHNCGEPDCAGDMAIGSIVEILKVGPFSATMNGHTYVWDYETTPPATLKGIMVGDYWLAMDSELRKLNGEGETESTTTEESIDLKGHTPLIPAWETT